MELRTKNKTWRQLIFRFKSSLIKARKHHVDLRWSTHQFNLLQQMIDPKHFASYFTDFGATMDLRSNATDNCSVDGHAVLAVFYKFSKQRLVDYINDNGEGDVHILVDCDVSQFIGGSESKGKSNDWIYHNACFKDEIKRNEDVREVQYDADGIEMVFTYYIATDACPTQYRCRQNFLMAARICVEMFPNKIRVVHFIATKFGFKGAWDGDGGRSKIQLRRAETKSIRSPNALTAFKYLFDTMTRGTLGMMICI